MRKRTLALIFIFVVVGIVGGAVLVGTVLWVRMTDPFRGYSENELLVEVPQGAATGEIGRALVEGGIVRDELTFRAALLWSGRSRALKAGEYRFDRPMSAVAVIDKLAKGDVYARRITFPEGLTVQEMAKIYESQGFGPARQFVEAARNVSLIKDLDAAAPDLEGYLYPETYAVPRTTTAAKLVSLMVGRFHAVFDEQLRRRAEEQGLTIREAVTLASLVEKETAKADERPVVAAVYRNRMKIGMGMQADPTVVYALQKAGRYDGNIRRDDLAFDSPYNTYKYAGLPPGPIAAPGKPSLEAAVAPADVPYLYFVSRNDGSHVFSATLDEHNKNVQQYQVAYFRERRLEEEREQAGARGQGTKGGSR
jgi:UPF0755 protein